MVRSEVKRLLNERQTSFQFILKAISDYTMSYIVFAPTVNKIIKKAKNKPGFSSMDLFVFFYEEMKELVEGTNYCPTKYNAQMLLKSVWETTQLQSYVIQQIRKGYVLLDEPEDVQIVEDTPKSKKKQKETPEQKKARLKRQAEAMRNAKAKKNGYEIKEEIRQQEAPTPQPQPQVQPQPQPQQKELTPEQRQQLEMLKNLKV